MEKRQLSQQTPRHFDGLKIRLSASYPGTLREVYRTERHLYAMNLHDFFRSFMGFPPRREPSFGDPPRPDNGGFGRDDNPYEGSMFGDPWDMFRHLDSVFRNFGLTEFPPFPHGTDVPAIEGPRSDEPGHLRDHMLKVPDYREPFLNAPDMGKCLILFACLGQQCVQREKLHYKEKGHSDLDEHVARSGLDSLLAPAPVPYEAPQQAPAWGGSSSTLRTFSSHNGKIQERTVVRDAHGNEEVIERRSLGDQSMTVRTIKRPDGDKAAFEQMWQSSSESPSDHSLTDSSIFRRLFGHVPSNRSQ
ncbi:hypothetical protein HPB50_016769 [Hyalomma asiaticum]|uniref:Uncharacterized protein n=1 Tax=Hyalomma asiaticum TaxID=266040 RepID=A0ACB7SZK8_HYAAI|nr:hypothetical protein HPB50_016769 [Hyalomma asiaticum]